MWDWRSISNGKICSAPEIFHDFATLRVTVALVLCRIRMRAPCSAMPSAAQIR